MELALQFGWGMMAHSKSLVDEWDGGSVILSPRDLNNDQLSRLSRDVSRLGGNPILDPQFYLPHSDHERLRSHSYWPGAFEPDHRLLPGEWASLLEALGELNRRLGTGQFMLPGILAESPEQMDVWFEQHETMLGEAQRLELLGAPSTVTVALGSDVATQTDACQRVIEWLDQWDVWGVYLVLAHPSGQYLTDNSTWLANALDLVGGLRLQGKRVVLGYSNQQMLIAAAAGANAIASGTWMNVRSFPAEKFRQVVDDEMRQRKLWYYAPSTLTEYGVDYLDMAARQGLLDLMRPEPAIANSYSAGLFTGPQPSMARFSEGDAFRHYLVCLRGQALGLTRPSFDETLDAVRALLARAEQSVATLAAREIRSQTREFTPDVVQACRAALVSLETGLGPRLRRDWSRLPND